ncbi:MAG: hypothetical protein F4093_03290 [Gammaproteobacteria bacterium]|nr:hypothetical protein [Gammaproteobacteria bacterium]
MKFLPWIGPDFGNSNDQGIPPRLLVVGESHYGEWDDDGLTAIAVENHITEEWNVKFMTSIQNAILGGMGEIAGEDRTDFYNAIAFYNFIQDMVPNPNTRPIDEMFECGTKSFLSCLDSVQPTHIVVFGFTVWDYLPEEGFSSCSKLEQDILKHLPSKYRHNEGHFDRGWIGQYEYSGGTALVMKCRHASRGFSPKQWHPAIRWFLQINRLDMNRDES